MIPLIYEKQIFMVLTFDFDIRPFIRLADTTDFGVSFLIRLEDFKSHRVTTSYQKVCILEQSGRKVNLTFLSFLIKH
jgi:hypothetical protein